MQFLHTIACVASSGLLAASPVTSQPPLLQWLHQFCEAICADGSLVVGVLAGSSRDSQPHTDPIPMDKGPRWGHVRMWNSL